MEHADCNITGFDEITVRQLISNIRVVSKDLIVVRFRDGTELEQTVYNSRKVKVG